MYRAVCTFALFCLAFGGAAGADTATNFCGRAEAHPIDQAFEAAMLRSEGFTVPMREGQAVAQVAWERELDRAYQELMQATLPQDRPDLRTAQQAWLAFDRAENRWHWSKSMYGDAGQAGLLNLAGDGLRRLRDRVCALEMALAEVRSKSFD